MHDTKPDSSPTSLLSRREAIGVLTAAVVLNGGQCSADAQSGSTKCDPPPDGGYGRPHQEECDISHPPPDPKQVRAILGLWLLFVTNLKFFPIDPHGVIKSVLDPDSVIKDLQFLPGKNADQQKSLLADMVMTINDPTQQNQVVDGVWKDPATQQTHHLTDVHINYGSALLIVQQLFNKLATGGLEVAGGQSRDGVGPSPAIYPVGTPYCPKEVASVLSIAQDAPQTPTP